MSCPVKNKEQLGTSLSTATASLMRDLLFDFANKSDIKCHQCGKNLDRKTFSIEHKIPWRDSDNPKELFYSINNVTFSHMSCNRKARRSTKGKKLRQRV